MNVTEFAEQIVFGNRLQDKLLIPGQLTDDPEERAGPNVATLIAPGRPADLQMRLGSGGNVQPPSDESLEGEVARGQLLHFLANHELLATELMALVLLKFPDAPRAFRLGILSTLQEEQSHTRMYLQRMKECGVEFGSFPVSGQFWEIVEPMQSPLDFVSRLSLTFEQANLDYSLHFANVFRKLGDTQTADLLQNIYEDEIGHVRHGLHWFRQWKDPKLSDWQAYQESLDFPMSPQRARGPRGAFNRDGRMRAGLTDDFIDAIEVFRQSRGRTATVRWFDPGAEAELAGELKPTEAALMDQLGKDLELVMVAMAKADDVILVRRLPSRAMRKQLIDVGFDLPEFVLLKNRSAVVDRKLHDFSPWAWTPKNYEVAQPLIASTRHAPERWRVESCDLYRKSWSAKRLRIWLEESDPGEIPSWFTTTDCAGIPVNVIDDVTAALAELSERGYATAIFKQDLATSGRGQRRLSCREPLSPEDAAWLRSRFAADALIDMSTEFQSGGKPRDIVQQPVGVVEPELDRLIDLSFLWHLPGDSKVPKFLGWTRPLVTAGRRYAGTRLGNAFSDCDRRLKQFLLADRCARLNAVVNWLQPRITLELTKRNFSGYFGVDAFACQDTSGNLQIKPLVELNPRMTMGHIALSLEKRLAPGTEAEFRIFTKAEWDELSPELNRVPFEGLPDGRWKTGVIWLAEVDDNTRLIPALLIGKYAIGKAKRGSSR